MLGEDPRTLSEKVWDAHVVRSTDGEPDLLYIDLHLLHEVTSPQAFDGLRLAGRPVRRADLTLATEDHNTPTDNLLTIADPVSRTQIETLRRNRAELGIRRYPLGDAQQGIVHVTGRPLGHGRAGGPRVRVTGRPALRPPGGGVGTGPRALAEPAYRRGRAVRDRGARGRRYRRAVRHLGHEPGPGGTARRERARPGGLRRPRRGGRGRTRAGVHGPAAGHRSAGRERRRGLRRLVRQRPAG